jgi:putative membrane protein
VVRVAGQVLGTDGPATSDLTGHGPAASRRRYTRALGPALTALAAAVVVILAADWSWWLLVIPVGVVLTALALASDRVRSLGHSLTDGYVIARSGSLNRRREALEIEHVIGWTFRSTWFQRRAGLATLVATTAGGRQAVTFLDVPEQRAVDLVGHATPALIHAFGCRVTAND